MGINGNVNEFAGMRKTPIFLGNAKDLKEFTDINREFAAIY